MVDVEREARVCVQEGQRTGEGEGLYNLRGTVTFVRIVLSRGHGVNHESAER